MNLSSPKRVGKHSPSLVFSETARTIWLLRIGRQRALHVGQLTDGQWAAVEESMTPLGVHRAIHYMGPSEHQAKQRAYECVLDRCVAGPWRVHRLGDVAAAIAQSPVQPRDKRAALKALITNPAEWSA